MSDRTGFISTEHTVWCGNCMKWEQVSTSRQQFAEKQFRQNGWRKTKKRGWVCKECYQKMRKGAGNEQNQGNEGLDK